MYWRLGVSLLCLWTSVTPVVTQTNTTQCELFYILQPVEHYTCNPFDGPFGLRIECVIYFTSRLDSTYDVYWYRILDAESNEQQEPEIVNHLESTSSFHRDRHSMRSRFRISSIDQEDSGVYWCQIVRLNEENNTIIDFKFEPSQKIILGSPSDYEGFPGCSNDYVSTQMSTCAINGARVLPFSASDAIQSTTTDPSDNSTSQNMPTEMFASTEEDEFLPPWGYAVIAGGALAVLIIVVCTLCMLVLICVWLRDKKKYNLPRSSQHKCDDATPGVFKPLVVSSNSQASELPPHLSAVRQSSGAGDYVEIPQSTAHNLSSRIAASNPGSCNVHKTDSNLGTSEMIQLSEHCGPHATTNYYQRQPELTTGLTTIEDGHEYHIINPNDRDKTETYSSPSLSPPRNHKPLKSPKPLTLPKPVALECSNSSRSNDSDKSSTSSKSTSRSTSEKSPIPTGNGSTCVNEDIGDDGKLQTTQFDEGDAYPSDEKHNRMQLDTTVSSRSVSPHPGSPTNLDTRKTPSKESII